MRINEKARTALAMALAAALWSGCSSQEMTIADHPADAECTLVYPSPGCGASAPAQICQPVSGAVALYACSCAGAVIDNNFGTFAEPYAYALCDVPQLCSGLLERVGQPCDPSNPE